MKRASVIGWGAVALLGGIALGFLLTSDEEISLTYTFGKDSNLADVLLDGWTQSSSDACYWNARQKTLISFPVPRSIKGDLLLTFEVDPFLVPQRDWQLVDIVANDHKVGAMDLHLPRETKTISSRVEHQIAIGRYVMTIHFLVHDPVSPHALLGWEETAPLAFCMRRLRITSIR